MTSSVVTGARALSPGVSVIIPVYNVEPYLRQCLESVASQTLHDIEVVCVNDCTPDNSQAILDEYAAKDNRFTLLRHERNKGLPGARNTGLKAARGQYIYFLDSDDFLACDDALEKMYEAAQTDDVDEVIGGTVCWYEDTGEKSLGWHKNYLENDVHGRPLIELPQLRSNVVAWNKLLRASLLREHNISFNEEILKHEDNPFSVKVHILAKRITILTGTTHVYRQNNSQSIMATVRKTDAYFRCMFCRDVFEFIESDEKYHQYRKIFYPRYLSQLVGSAGILAQFAPSEEEKAKLLQEWKQIVDMFPRYFPEVPPLQKRIFAFIKTGDMENAWQAATSEPAELGRLKEVNDRLREQIDDVRNSRSWRITSPMRKYLRKLRGY